MEEIRKKYGQLAAKLGDVQFKIELLKQNRQQLVAQIQELNQAVEILKQMQPKDSSNNEQQAEKPNNSQT